MTKRVRLTGSLADLWCLSRIPDPTFPSLIPGKKDSGSRIRIRIKVFKYFIPKKCFEALGNMIEDVHPGSVSRIQILDPGVESGSATLPTGLLLFQKKDNDFKEGLSHRAPTPSPLPLRVAKTGKNKLDEEITPLLPTGIGERFSQTISNLGHAALLSRCELPL